MNIATSTCKRKGKLVVSFIAIVALGYLVSPMIQHLYHGAIRRVAGSGIPFVTTGFPVHKESENLPDVVVESGRTLCCRMKLCDFRFPFPHGARIAQIDPVSGGGDTIKGAIYVTNADGGMVDLEAYAKLIYRNGFNSSADDSRISATSADGGYIVAEVTGSTTKIAFSFFGDK